MLASWVLLRLQPAFLNADGPDSFPFPLSCSSVASRDNNAEHSQQRMLELAREEYLELDVLGSDRRLVIGQRRRYARGAAMDGSGSGLRKLAFGCRTSPISLPRCKCRQELGPSFMPLLMARLEEHKRKRTSAPHAIPEILHIASHWNPHELLPAARQPLVISQQRLTQYISPSDN